MLVRNVLIYIFHVPIVIFNSSLQLTFQELYLLVLESFFYTISILLYRFNFFSRASRDFWCAFWKVFCHIGFLHFMYFEALSLPAKTIWTVMSTFYHNISGNTSWLKFQLVWYYCGHLVSAGLVELHAYCHFFLSFSLHRPMCLDSYVFHAQHLAVYPTSRQSLSCLLKADIKNTCTRKYPNHSLFWCRGFQSPNLLWPVVFYPASVSSRKPSLPELLLTAKDAQKHSQWRAVLQEDSSVCVLQGHVHSSEACTHANLYLLTGSCRTCDWVLWLGLWGPVSHFSIQWFQFHDSVSLNISPVSSHRHPPPVRPVASNAPRIPKTWEQEWLRIGFQAPLKENHYLLIGIFHLFTFSQFAHAFMAATSLPWSISSTFSMFPLLFFPPLLLD